MIKSQKHIVYELLPDEGEFERIRQVILADDLPRDLQLSLCLAAEELFVNICSYAFPEKTGTGESVLFTYDRSDRILMCFEDGGIPFNPTENRTDIGEYDIDTEIGGLGRLIAFTIADEVNYEYTDGKNILTLIKYLKEKNDENFTE